MPGTKSHESPPSWLLNKHAGSTPHHRSFLPPPATIAQMLAGALAVLVAFVVVRLGKLDDTIGHGAATLRSKGGDFEGNWDVLGKEGPEALEAFNRKATGNTLKIGGGWEAYEPAFLPMRDKPIIKRRQASGK